MKFNQEDHHPTVFEPVEATGTSDPSTSIFQPRRVTQNHFDPTPITTAPVHEAENTVENSVMQGHEAEGAGTYRDVQVHTSVPTEDFTISVDQVREHFRSRGLTKSKDTVQRWCRQGDLSCQKRGVLGRYFTTEASLKALEQKLLPDMIAENAGAISAANPSMKQHAAETEDARTDVQVHAPDNAPARTSTQIEARANEAEQDVVAPTEEVVRPEGNTAIENAQLRAEVQGLRDQLTQSQATNQFLQDELVSARGQRGDVVKISERMLGTLETIAIGGRLERPREQGSGETQATVHYRPERSDPGRV